MKRRRIVVRQLGIGALVGGLCISLIALGRGTAKDPREGTWEVIGADELEVHTTQRDPIFPQLTQKTAERFEFLERVVPEISGREMTIDDIADLVGKVADVNVMVRWSVLDAAGVEHKTKHKITLKNLTVAQFLRVVLNEFRLPDMGYAVEPNLITISTKEDLDQLVVVRIYNIRDLMLNAVRVGSLFPHDQRQTGGGAGVFYGSRPKPASPLTEEELFLGIRQLLVDTVDRNTWIDNGGKVGTIYYWAGTMVIAQTPENHQQIAAILRMMREAARREQGEPTTRPSPK